MIEVIEQLRIPLGDQRVVTIPLGISKEDFELLIATLKLWERRIVVVEPFGDERPPT